MMYPGKALRYALRTFAARRGLFAIRVVTLALVVGAGSAVFLVADAMLLRPLPFEHADRLVRVFTQPPGMPDFAHANPLHPLEFLRFRERPGLLERLEGIWAAERAVGGDGEPESVPAAMRSERLLTDSVSSENGSAGAVPPIDSMPTPYLPASTEPAGARAAATVPAQVRKSLAEKSSPRVSRR